MRKSIFLIAYLKPEFS